MKKKTAKTAAAPVVDDIKKMRRTKLLGVPIPEATVETKHIGPLTDKATNERSRFPALTLTLGRLAFPGGDRDMLMSVGSALMRYATVHWRAHKPMLPKVTVRFGKWAELLDPKSKRIQFN